jgi:hypothetical protein
MCFIVAVEINNFYFILMAQLWPKYQYTYAKEDTAPFGLRYRWMKAHTRTSSKGRAGLYFIEMLTAIRLEV